MKFRLVEEMVNGQNLLCPYVVCGTCDEVIRAGDAGIVVWPKDRDRPVGDVEGETYHNNFTCAPKGYWRSFGEWWNQIGVNSVSSAALEKK